MAPEWDIGQRDVAAVERLAEVICRLPTLSSAADLPSEASVIEGGSFSAYTYAVPDRGVGCQLRIYFSVTGGTVRSEWSAWVRCDRPDRTDRTPVRLEKRFHKAFKPANVTSWEKSEEKTAPRFAKTAHWWVARDLANLQKDITAQIWVFLLQTGILGESRQGYAIPWLWKYLERSFRLTSDESPAVLESLLRQYWRAPSARAWPAYVKSWVYRLPTRVEQRWARAGSRRGAKSESDAFTVAEAADKLEIAQSTLYERIRRGLVKTTFSGAKRFQRILISPTEVERVRGQLRPKPKSLIELRQRATGSAKPAARKWVWRRLRSGASVEEIARSLR